MDGMKDGRYLVRLQEGQRDVTRWRGLERAVAGIWHLGL